MHACRDANDVDYEGYRPLVVPPIIPDAYQSLTEIEKRVLAHFLLLNRPEVCIELGMLRGATTAFLCDVLESNDISGKVTGFDLPETVDRLRADETGTFLGLEQRGRLEMIPGRLPLSLSGWLGRNPRPIDLALVDATHDYRNVLGELQLLWPRLSNEGFIICHDYSEKFQGVRYAVDHFTRTKGALMLPLLTSARAERAGCSSVLVALARRRYPFRRREWWGHRLLKAKSDIVQGRVLGRIWHRWLRPVFRPGR